MAFNTTAWETSFCISEALYYVGESENIVGLGNFRQTFNLNQAYNKNDMVIDANNNLYICIDGMTGPAGPTGIALTDSNKWTQVSYNDSKYKFNNFKIDGSNISSNNHPNGVQQTINIPAGTYPTNSVIIIEAWLTKVSGNNGAWAIFIDDQQLTSGMSTNNRNPCRIRMLVIKYGNNGSGSPADIVGYLNHSDANAGSLKRGTITNRDTSVDFDVSLVKVGGGGTWRCEFFQTFVYSL